MKAFLFHGHTLEQEKLRDELGDVLWYFMLLCHTANLSLEEIMIHNIEKLRARYPQGFETERSLRR